MQNTIHRNSHSITNVRTQNVRRDAANDAPQQNSNVDSYVPAQQDSETTNGGTDSIASNYLHDDKII